MRIYNAWQDEVQVNYLWVHIILAFLLFPLSIFLMRRFSLGRSPLPLSHSGISSLGFIRIFRFTIFTHFLVNATSIAVSYPDPEDPEISVHPDFYYLSKGLYSFLYYLILNMLLARQAAIIPITFL
jgi:hypothetical protein